MSNEEPYHEYPAGPYDITAQRTPIPPPPPPPTGWYSNPYDPYRKQKRSPWYYVLIAFLLCVIGASVLVIWLKFHAEIATTPTSITTHTVTTQPATTTSTPTVNTSNPLQTSDFPTFIGRFSTANSNYDYNDIQKVADQKNFRLTPIHPADYWDLGWGYTYHDLMSGNITISIRRVVITPEEAKFNCNGAFYGTSGVTVKGYKLMDIPNANVAYDVGSIFSSIPEKSEPPDSVVFVFEQPNHTGQWFWRGYVFGNTTNCQ
ncbi:hypothetical protein [Ktedonobacter racemifer]|uniref:Uncharacterized protein n=1 Tax=Ktedonobacter racemifer DSM 44963 TaxID=485913 RepID=D6U038_KTERA|nr:hypothetical protein [Ktedonobacter racemifer]EFH82178.1 hypothetical protein Krac_2964 [Ktedonobacter racemifer DSM 44963]